MTAIHYPLFAPVAAAMCEVADQVTEPARLTFQELAVERKSDGSCVTEIDRRSEQVLTERFEAILPGSRVLGEETAGSNWRQSPLLDAGGDVWIIDPIDGTARFIRGESYGVMVALRRDHKVEAAWIYYPDTQDMLFASVQDATLRVTRDAAHRLIAYPVVVPQLQPQDMALVHYDRAYPRIDESPYGGLTQQFSANRRSQCIALDAKELVMQGNTAVCINYYTPWDTVPVAFIAERAGAPTVVDFSGQPLTCRSENYVMTPTATATEGIIKRIRQASSPNLL